MRKFSDHLGIKIEIRIPKLPETKGVNKEIIDYKNVEGWSKYRDHTDEIANRIKIISSDENLNINKIRELIRIEDDKVQRKCFGTI